MIAGDMRSIIHDISKDIRKPYHHQDISIGERRRKEHFRFDSGESFPHHNPIPILKVLACYYTSIHGPAREEGCQRSPPHQRSPAMSQRSPPVVASHTAAQRSPAVPHTPTAAAATACDRLPFVPLPTRAAGEAKQESSMMISYGSGSHVKHRWGQGVSPCAISWTIIIYLDNL